MKFSGIFLLMIFLFANTLLFAEDKQLMCIDGNQYYFSDVFEKNDKGIVLSGSVDLAKSKIVFENNGKKYEYQHFGIYKNKHGFDYRFRVNENPDLDMQWIDGKTRRTSTEDLVITTFQMKVICGYIKNGSAGLGIKIQGKYFDLSNQQVMVELDQETKKPIWVSDAVIPWTLLAGGDGEKYLFTLIDGPDENGQIQGGLTKYNGKTFYLLGKELPKDVGYRLGFKDGKMRIAGIYGNKYGINSGIISLTASDEKDYDFLLDGGMVWINDSGKVFFGKFITTTNGIQKKFGYSQMNPSEPATIYDME